MQCICSHKLKSEHGIRALRVFHFYLSHASGLPVPKNFLETGVKEEVEENNGDHGHCEMLSKEVWIF